MDGGNGMIINGNVITADEGKVLVKGDIIATVIHLGVNDSIDNWIETDLKEEISSDEALSIIMGGDTV